MSYYSFLKEQAPAFQDETLGKTNGAKLRSGELDAEAFNKLSLEQIFRPISLDDMVKKQELSFLQQPKG